jgi:hypothetical protein
VKGLFQDSDTLSEQYVEGSDGAHRGLQLLREHVPREIHLGLGRQRLHGERRPRPARASRSQRGTGTFKKGDIVTFAGCNRCHPESKADTGSLQTVRHHGGLRRRRGQHRDQPGHRRGRCHPERDGFADQRRRGDEAGRRLRGLRPVSLAFHKDAFTFVTAPLPLPRNQQMAARAEVDGISLRIWQGTDITNDKFPTRIDILYGYKTLRGQLASRLANN